jgi:hypothetical protein
MQVRFTYVDAKGVTKTQTRTIRDTYTSDGVYYAIGFDNEFNADVQSSFVSWERLGEKYTLDKWKTSNDINEGNSSVAAYSNDADLGFGRRMVGNKNDDDVFFYVGNYSTAEQANSGAVAQTTVAMEYSSVGSTGPKETQFYVFNSSRRIVTIDLDQEGEKAIPGLCQNCHDNSFIVFDAESFGYTSASPRDDHEVAFKALNELVKDTNPTVLATEIIDKWYETTSTQLSTALPSDWEEDKRIYNEVLKPYCRSCHLSVRSSGPMKHSDFFRSPTYFMDKFCDTSFTMPHAKVTRNKLMNDDNALDLLTNRFMHPFFAEKVRQSYKHSMSRRPLI